MNIDRLKEMAQEYLDMNEDNLETDGYIPGQDVTLEQAKALLDDFILALTCMPDPDGVPLTCLKSDIEDFVQVGHIVIVDGAPWKVIA